MRRESCIACTRSVLGVCLASSHEGALSTLTRTMERSLCGGSKEAHPFRALARPAPSLPQPPPPRRDKPSPTPLQPPFSFPWRVVFLSSEV